MLQFPQHDEQEVQNIDISATSIYLETKKNVSKNDFIEKFLDEFEKNYDDFLINGIENLSNKGEILC